MLADYAYLGESALSDYENALSLKEEDFPDRRLICHLYAQAGQAALNAMLVHVHGPIEPDGINLLSLLTALNLLDPNVPECLMQPFAKDSARLLSRFCY